MMDTDTPPPEASSSALLEAVQQLLLAGNGPFVTISAVAARAGVPPGRVYDHYATVGELLDAVGGLLLDELHRLLRAGAPDGQDDPARRFALATQQALRLAVTPGYGTLLFDAGLPVDRLLAGLRDDLLRDVTQGVAEGRFVSDDVDVTASILTGAIIGLAVDLHRGRLPVGAIDTGAVQLLGLLGIGAEEATGLALPPGDLVPPRPVPLSIPGIADV